MKLINKKFLFVIITALVIAFSAVACTPNGGGESNLSIIEQSYNIAVQKGYEGSIDEWVDMLKGETGADGKSAYELAVESKDFNGTLAEWLDSLKGAKGDKGETGDAGRGIADIKIVGGNLYVTYTDSEEAINVGRVTGEQGTPGTNGDDGLDGRGIDDLKISGGILMVKYTDSSTYVQLGGVLGAKGDKGDAGRGVADVKVENGNLYIKYTDSDEYVDLGKVEGEDGKNGNDGIDGKNGDDLNIEDIYAAAVKNGYTGDFLTFLKEYLGGNTSGQGASQSSEQVVSKTLLSSVAIASKFSGSSVSGGSGVIYKGNKTTGEAYIITNFHVVYDSSHSPAICKEIYVFFYGVPYVSLSKDNPSYTPEQIAQYRVIEDLAVKAEFVAGSQSADLAIIKVKTDVYKNGPYRPAELIEDSDYVYEGERSYVVGNAEGRGLSAAEGIISLQSQEMTLTVDSATNVSYTYRVFRTDAAVNHGNSGGGLFNKDGKLMGIVNSKTQTVTVDNMGYAIPLNVVIGTVENMLKRASDKTKVDAVSANGFGYNKCLLGVTVRCEDFYADYDEQTGLVTDKAKIVVVELSETGSAKGYLMPGDVILSAKVGEIEREMFRLYQLGDILLHASQGDVIKVTVLRGGATVTLNIPLNNSTYNK